MWLCNYHFWTLVTLLSTNELDLLSMCSLARRTGNSISLSNVEETSLKWIRIMENSSRDFQFSKTVLRNCTLVQVFANVLSKFHILAGNWKVMHSSVLPNKYKSLSKRRFWAMEDNRNWWAVFLFNLPSHYHIYIYKHIFTRRDD